MRLNYSVETPCLTRRKDPAWVKIAVKVAQASNVFTNSLEQVNEKRPARVKTAVKCMIYGPSYSASLCMVVSAIQ
jgi:hypothetical protein